MAKGKAHTSEASSEGSHSSFSSMKRLSSLSSLHQLLPFSRSRRTTIDTNDSNPPIQPSPAESHEEKRILEEVSHNSRPAPPHAYGGFLRKSNYASVPDSASAGLPRRKTFSNLPLPVKSRKQAAHTASVQPIPSLTASRFSAPSEPSRRHLSHKSVNNTSGRHGSKLPRSDTEPLLVGKGKGAVSLAQMLKENVPVFSKSRAGPPGFDDLFASSVVSNDSDTTSIISRGRTRSRLPREPSFHGVLPNSSPSLKGKQVDRTAEFFLGQPQSQVPFAQRWNSQPNLFGRSQKTESIRPHPTPPPSVLPSFSHQLTRSLLGESPFTKPLGKLDESEVFQAGEDTTPYSPSLQAVSAAEPLAYWAGRLSTLQDRAKDQETKRYFAKLDEEFQMRHGPDKVYENAISTVLTRKALESLYDCCVTSEARESFVLFQLQYAALLGDPELARPIGRTKPFVLKSRQLDLGKVPSNTPSPSSSSRSVSFVKRLLGRGKRGSINS
ncbi:hypothetical protein AMS68_000540 [Peltaster fructicola]|uniref:Uncharacterized protein n=1 Tax=Peltaster fructicola TaxID=286661 RepID=A0A6H0XJW3_9PEZI|nr:hypothetical protein AMS68_000540 [Peltaster fructicola]